MYRYVTIYLFVLFNWLVGLGSFFALGLKGVRLVILLYFRIQILCFVRMCFCSWFKFNSPCDCS